MPARTAECDLLMIHTGFDRVRQTDVPTFEQKGPGSAPTVLPGWWSMPRL